MRSRDSAFRDILTISSHACSSMIRSSNAHTYIYIYICTHTHQGKQNYDFKKKARTDLYTWGHVNDVDKWLADLQADLFLVVSCRIAKRVNHTVESRKRLSIYCCVQYC